MGKDANTLDDLRRAILHQTVVGGNIGFALGGVDNECVDFVAAAAQLGAGRETRAAQSGHAKLVNTLNQRFAGFILVIVPAIAFKIGSGSKGMGFYADITQEVTPAKIRDLPELKKISLYADRPQEDEFDPYFFTYW